MYNIMKSRFALCPALAITAAAALTMSSFAMGGMQDSTSYGHLQGQQESTSIHNIYSTAGNFSTDEEREDWYESNSIGDDTLTASENPDTAALLKAGIIDSDTADAIEAYASAKHDEIQLRYQSDISAMSPAERESFFAQFDGGISDADPADELCKAGIITADQASAISAYLKDTSTENQ